MSDERRKPRAVAPRAEIAGKEVTVRTAIPGSAQEEALTQQRPKRAKRSADLQRKREDKQAAVRLAQIVNLQLAGMSLAEIGVSTGMSPDEVDRLLQKDAARYVKNQPSLRTHARNFIGGRFMELMDATWPAATDVADPKMLEHQDRAIRILDSMRKLYGADAPVQTEVKVEHAPEAVEQIISRIADAQGMGYDTAIFDAEIVEDEMSEAVAQAHEAEQASYDAAGEDRPDDEDDENDEVMTQ